MNPASDEYEWGYSRVNPFEPMTYQDACRTVDFMSDPEIHEIGYHDETELLDFIDRHYMLYEAIQ